MTVYFAVESHHNEFTVAFYPNASFTGAGRIRFSDTGLSTMLNSNKRLERVRVVVADDNTQVREMVLHLLTPYFEVVGTAADGAAAFEMVMLLNPEVVVLDISMPIMSGIEAAAGMKKKGSHAKTVFLTVHEDPDFVRAALTSGASAYVVKSQMATDLYAAIRMAMEGNFFISPCCALSEDSLGH